MFVLMVFCLLSCNNDLINNDNGGFEICGTKSVEFIPDTIELKFVYKGEEYISNSLLYENYIDVLNPDVKFVYQEIKSKPMAALMRHDGFVEYFDTKEDLMKSFSDRTKMKINTPSERIGYNDGNGVLEDDWDNNPKRYKARAFLYDDRNFSGRRCKDIVLDNGDGGKRIPNLKDYDSFNDKCSSLKVQNYNFGVYALLVVYENDTYNEYDSGNSYYFYAGYMSQEEREYSHANLKYIFVNQTPPVPTARIDSWNDRISSCEFYFCSPHNFPEVD